MWPQISMYTDCNLRPPVGCIVVDSLISIGHTWCHTFAAEVLRAVLASTGMACMIVCVPGILVAPSYHPLTYRNILEILRDRFPSVKYLLSVRIGNGVHRYALRPSGAIAAQQSTLRGMLENGTDVANFMKDKYECAASVIGGLPSPCWNHFRGLQFHAEEEEDQVQYDHAAAASLRRMLQGYNISFWTELCIGRSCQLYRSLGQYLDPFGSPYTFMDGVFTVCDAQELHGIEMLDQVEHHSPRPKQVFIAAFAERVSLCLPRAKL